MHIRELVEVESVFDYMTADMVKAELSRHGINMKSVNKKMYDQLLKDLYNYRLSGTIGDHYLTN